MIYYAKGFLNEEWNLWYLNNSRCYEIYFIIGITKLTSVKKYLPYQKNFKQNKKVKKRSQSIVMLFVERSIYIKLSSNLQLLEY